MTYPWVSGEVLSAADLNAYAGLVLVKTQTIGTAVASVTVSDAFSSTFDNYRITINGGVGSTTTLLSMKLGASTANYYQALTYADFATATVAALAVNNGSGFSYSGVATPNVLQFDMTLQNPNLAKFTEIWGAYVSTVGGFSAGYHGVATAYTSFIVAASVGTLTGGTIRVYGYNNG